MQKNPIAANDNRRLTRAEYRKWAWALGQATAWALEQQRRQRLAREAELEELGAGVFSW